MLRNRQQSGQVRKAVMGHSRQNLLWRHAQVIVTREKKQVKSKQRLQRSQKTQYHSQNGLIFC